MTDKDLAIHTIQRLPRNASLQQIRERINFLAGLREAEESLNCGEGIRHDEVKKQFNSWINQWPSPTKSSGRRKPSKT